MNKKQVAKISAFITSIFIIFLSITYAFMDMTLAGLKRQVITAGNYELEIDEDENNLTIQNALPMYDEVGMLQDPFTFRLINKDNKGLEYYLKLVDVTNESKEKLDTSIVKYAFTKNGENTIDYLSHIEDEKIDHDFIAPGKTIEYALRMWIDIDVTDESVIQGKNLSYKIAVDVFEDTRLSGMMKPSGIVANILSPDNVSEEAYWPYYKQITSVTFEHEILIPKEAKASWDISLKEDNSVQAYIVEDGTTVNYTVQVLDPNAFLGVSTENRSGPGYKLYIQGEKIYANNSSPNSGLFTNFVNLKSIQNLSYLDISMATDLSYIFYGCSELSSIDMSGFDTSNITNMTSMFSGCSNLTGLNLNNLDTSNATSVAGMFSGCTKLTSINLSSFNTSNVISMASMFSGCSGLTSLNLSNLDTSNVTNMADMFYRCTKLTSINLSGFNTSNVTSMAFMFSGCSSLTSLDISHFDTSNVVNMSSMFGGFSGGCTSLNSLNLSTFDTSNVINMSSMFGGCSNLKSLDISRFNTANVTNMSSMFSGCKALTSLNLSSFNTSNVTSMSSMFSECNALTSLNLSSFNTLNVTDMGSMFNNCKALTSIDFHNCDTSNVTGMGSMFSGCVKLMTLKLGNFTLAKNDTGLGGMWVFGLMDHVPNNCRITVKYQSNKNEILSNCSTFTNITVTG